MTSASCRAVLRRASAASRRASLFRGLLSVIPTLAAFFSPRNGGIAAQRFAWTAAQTGIAARRFLRFPRCRSVGRNDTIGVAQMYKLERAALRRAIKALRGALAPLGLELRRLNSLGLRGTGRPTRAARSAAVRAALSEKYRGRFPCC